MTWQQLYQQGEVGTPSGGRAKGAAELQPSDAAAGEGSGPSRSPGDGVEGSQGGTCDGGQADRPEPASPGSTGEGGRGGGVQAGRRLPLGGGERLMGLRNQGTEWAHGVRNSQKV